VRAMLRSSAPAAAVGTASHPDWLPAVRTAFEEGYREEIAPESTSQSPPEATAPLHGVRATALSRVVG